jgi:hypothetical protein
MRCYLKGRHQDEKVLMNLAVHSSVKFGGMRITLHPRTSRFTLTTVMRKQKIIKSAIVMRKIKINDP